jgi:polar amino acid transport system substrate-binding protein
MRALSHFFSGWMLLLGAVLAQSPASAPGTATATPAPALPPTVSQALEPKATGSLRVAVDPHAPPFIYKSGEKYSGLEAEFARGLGEALNRPVVFVEASTENLIPLLLDDKADIIMSGYANNRLRQVRVAFCNPYLRVGQLVLCRRADLSIYSNNANLQNIRSDIGVVAGSTGDLLVGSQFSFAGRKPSATYDEAVKALLDKKVDLVLADYPVAIWESAQNEATVAIVPNMLSQEDMAWAVRKDDDALRAAANAYLEQLRLSGKLQQTVRKWVPDATAESIAPGSTPLPAAAAPGASGTAKATPDKK